MSAEAMPQDEKARLEGALKEDYESLAYEGDKCCDFVTVSVTGAGARRWYEGMRVVTRSERTGEHFRWMYDRGLTENQDDEYDPSPVEPVTAARKVVTITEWEAAE